MHIKKLSIGGLKPTAITPVPGVISPQNNNSAKPNMVGSQATVKTPKSKKMPDAMDKPSQFFKAESFNTPIKKTSVENLRSFLEKQRSKKRS